MRPDSFIISLLIFSLFMVVGAGIWNDIISPEGYNLNLSTDEFKDVYNITDEIYDTTRDMQKKTIDAEIKEDEEPWQSLVTGTYSSVRLIRNTFSLFGEIMNVMAREIGIPLIFVTAATTILLVSIIFSIIYLIFRFKG